MKDEEKKNLCESTQATRGHLSHADTYHILKAVEYELLFYEWENLEKAIV